MKQRSRYEGLLVPHRCHHRRRKSHPIVQCHYSLLLCNETAEMQYTLEYTIMSNEKCIRLYSIPPPLRLPTVYGIGTGSDGKNQTFFR